MAKKKSTITPATFDPNAAAAPGSGIFGLPFKPSDCRVVLIPVPWDVTTSYRRGAAKGPKAIHAASTQVDLLDRMTGEPYKSGICMLPASRTVQRINRVEGRRALPIIARGGNAGRSRKLQRDLADVNGAGASLNLALHRQVTGLLKGDRIVGVIGGDHSVPFGSIQAHAERHPGIGILHLDAHADLRRGFEGFEWSHASIMDNVLRRIPGVGKLVQVGIRDFSREEMDRITNHPERVRTFFDEDLKARLHDGEAWTRICKEIIAALPDKVYLSFDIDGLDPQLCPHTGTPVPGGLSFDQAVTLLRLVAKERTIVGFDLCEVAPGPNGDEWDGNVAARLLYKMIGCTLLSQDRKKPS